MNDRKDLLRQLSRLQTKPAGQQYWRSLEELAEMPAFEELVKQEFPDQADVWPNHLNRRKFLSLMAASLALGGLAGCSIQPAPAEKIVPYVRRQEELVPGRPLFFATTMTYGGDAVGLLVESHEGRPTKVEGNLDHPASLGATDPIHQASILGLYDPDRLQTVIHQGEIRTWRDAERALREVTERSSKQNGAGLRVLSGAVTSPTLSRQREQLLGKYPEVQWHVWEPVNDDHSLAGARLAFGRPLVPVYDFSQADVIVSLDADFLTTGAGHVRYARDFSKRRTVWETDRAGAMNRLYVIEPTVTCTGAKADHRLALSALEIERLARNLAARLGVLSAGSNAGSHQGEIQAIGADLEAHRGRSLVLAGRRQPPWLHALAHAMNERLGNVGKTVRYIEPPAAQAGDQTPSLRELCEDMNSGSVDAIMILGGNPVYDAPADLDFVRLLAKVPFRARWSLYADETSQLCDWQLPATHFLEAWSDARAFDGTASLVQPLIQPLYQGRSAHEVLAVLSGAELTSGQEIVLDYWQNRPDRDPSEFADWWQTALHDGLIADSQSPAVQVELRDDWQTAIPQLAPATDNLELHFDADPAIFDGSFANNGWLQELPKPITKLTWDNAVLISPATAQRLGVTKKSYAHGGEHGGYEVPVIELRVRDRSLRGPVWIVPGQADDVVTVHLGYGRKSAGRIGGNQDQAVGFNAYQLRTADQPWFASGVEIIPTNNTYQLACTQSHHQLDREGIVRSFSASDLATETQRREEHSSQAEKDKSLYPAYDYSPPVHKWGMAIDMTACIGCSACVVACQAENNIPVVGKEQVLFGREMHWLRVDRYFSGPAEEPAEFHFQPLPCMHCEHAPCEYVCPVMATVHSADGLNDMVYNRCVGTRFCSNNCPYKVRRFNFLAYADFDTPSLRMQYNPDVTVRSRGVMEKCTYCVQRIRAAQHNADAGGPAIRDGDVLTACQAVCPAQAILFGDLNDPQGRVAQAKASSLNYSLLEELNTFPRTTYLAEVKNPNPAWPREARS